MNTGRAVSVIIPVYNGERYLAEALASVAAQTRPADEVLVIDDGSTDGTAQVAQSFQYVRYACQPHRGVAVALNYGIQLARGDYFSFLDADDLWIETKLELQMECFARDPGLEVLFTQMLQFWYEPGTGRVLYSEPIPGYFKGTMVIERGAFFRVGLFDPRWRMGDFIEWYTRARDLPLNIKMLDDILLKRRIHESNLGVRERDQRIAFVHMLKHVLDRRQSQDQ